ncbi:DUF2207 domain-containing protein [Aliihoeflea sp. PC F10.4]
MFARLLIVACLTIFPLVAQAAEEIRSFRSNIEVGADGVLRVSEEIIVNVEGQDISRGIFRDIPLRYEDANGRMREVGLDILSVTRDGAPESYRAERASGMLRVRIGDADMLLAHGVHTYEITYETTRQIRFFDDHDELYWNVTGNGWDFPILEATADIRLPAGARTDDVTFFTGPYGSTDRDASAQVLDGGNRIVVTADGRLAPRAGLTAVVAIPKGVIAPPGPEEERAFWWDDYGALTVGGIGLAIVLLYYFWAWSRVGRDPPAGVMVPRWTPPDGVSPALMNYIDKRGFRGQGWDAFSAAVVDLAIKGHVELEDLERDLTIRRKGSGMPSGLPVGEAAILKEMPTDGDTLMVDKANGERVQKTGRAFRSAIESEHHTSFYRHNISYLIAGVILSVLTVLAMIVLTGMSDAVITVMLATSLLSLIIAYGAVQVGRSFYNARTFGQRIMAVVAAGFMAFVVQTMISGAIGVFLPWWPDISVVAPFLVYIAILTANITFFFLMGAPTPLGQKKTEEIAGLRHYLTVAEKDRMNMQGAPEMSPKHFETLLPYAMALGVEKPWSKAFDTWLAAAMAAGTVAGYVGPNWYHGRTFNAGSIGSGLGSMADSMAKSFTASLPAPKSSSSGFSSGGGFSGGGGGGGGGGGW